MFLWKCGSCRKEIVVPYKGPEYMCGFSSAVCSECYDKNIIISSEDWPVERIILEENNCRLQCDQDGMIFECRTLEELGHIRLCSLSDLSKYTNDYSLKLFTVRSKGKIDPNKYGMIHVDQLSPSSKLFNKYNNHWKKGLFTDDELKKIDKSSGNWFDTLYTPLFDRELHNNDSLAILNKIEEALNKGINVLLICYCKDRSRCHLSSLGKYFKEKEYKVIES